MGNIDSYFQRALFCRFEIKILLFVSLLKNEILNTLEQLVALSQFQDEPLKINQNFALLLNFRFNHDALTSTEVFREAINSHINNTKVFIFCPTKIVTAKR